MAYSLKKFKDFALDLLKQGTSAKELSKAISIGSLLGIFPILGVTTTMSIIIGKVSKLNIPTILAANYAVFPVQIVMIYVLIVAGETLFGLENKTNYEFFKSIMGEDLSFIFKTIGTSLGTAVVSWIILCALIYYPIYRLVLLFVEKIKP